MSGLSAYPPANLVSLALRGNYLDRPCRIYLVLIDPNGATVIREVTVFEGRMDKLDIALASGDDGTFATCQMTAVSHLARWSEPGHQRWNHQAQLATYGDDYGFEFLEAMVDREVWWPSPVGTPA